MWGCDGVERRRDCEDAGQVRGEGVYASLDCYSSLVRLKVIPN